MENFEAFKATLAAEIGLGARSAEERSAAELKLRKWNEWLGKAASSTNFDDCPCPLLLEIHRAYAVALNHGASNAAIAREMRNLDDPECVGKKVGNVPNDVPATFSKLFLGQVATWAGWTLSDATKRPNAKQAWALLKACEHLGHRLYRASAEILASGKVPTTSNNVLDQIKRLVNASNPRESVVERVRRYAAESATPMKFSREMEQELAMIFEGRFKENIGGLATLYLKLSADTNQSEAERQTLAVAANLAAPSISQWTRRVTALLDMLNQDDQADQSD